MKRRQSLKTTIVAASAAILLIIQGGNAQGWYDPGYLCRCPVAITNPGNSSLTNYQVQVLLGSSFGFSKAKSDGSDLRITSHDGTTLIPFWIENWNPSGHQASIWVKLPLLPIAGDSIYVYYGNPSPSLPAPQVIEVPPTGPFTKAIDNPVVPIGDPGSGASLPAENIVFDSVTSHYWWVFADYRDNSVGLVWSDTPTSASSWHWLGDVISYANAPHIIQWKGLWYIFYADRQSGTWGDISVDTSSSVSGPYSYCATVLYKRPSSWESYRVDEPYVFKREDGKWMLMYMAETGSTDEQVGYAIADSILGPYTKYAGNPCLPFGPSGSYDAGTVADPFVVDYHGTYYIGYACSPTSSSPWQTGYATTTDWVTFTKHGILLPLASAGWDAVNSFRGAITRINNTYVYSYTGDSYKMGIATEPIYQTLGYSINNADSVFDFYDDFSGTTIDGSKWSGWKALGDGGSVTVSNGIATISASGGQNGQGLVGTGQFGPGNLFECSARHATADGSGTTAGELGLGQDFSSSLRILDYNSPNFEIVASSSGTGGNTFVPLQRSLDNADFLLHRIYWKSSSEADYALGSDSWTALTSNIPPTTLSPWMLALAYPNAASLQVDWVRIRKWVGVDPVVTVGPEYSQLISSISIQSADTLIAGINSAALDTVDTQDIAAPPAPPSDYLYLYFLLAPGAPLQNYSVDIKRDEAALATKAKYWALCAMSDRVDSTVTMQFGNCTLPPGYRPIVYDLQTGRYQDVRAQGSFAFVLPHVSNQVMRFHLFIGDSAKPVVSLLHPNGGEILTGGSRDTIRWTSSDGSGVLRHYIYYSITGAPPYMLIDSTNGMTDSLIWTPTYGTASARIKIVARDSVLNEQSDSSKQTFTVQSQSSFAAQAGWNMVSVPLQQADMTPGGVFGDNYGAVPFYVYEYNSTGRYGVPALLVPGQGYWLGSNSAQTVDAIGITPGSFVKTLSAGFNMIGNPFPVPEPRESLQFTLTSQSKSWTDAVNAGWLSSALWGYSQFGYVSGGSSLNVWQGYWIAALVDGLAIQFASPGTGTLPKHPVSPKEPVSATTWDLDLKATLVTSEGKACTDAIAGFGVKPNIKTGFDNRYDLPRPPRGPEQTFVEVCFSGMNGEFPKALGNSYARIYVGKDEIAAWGFEVNTSAAGGKVTLTWNKDDIKALDVNVKLILRDLSANARTDMRKVGSYTYTQSEQSREFAIDNGEVKMPTSFQLDQNYPNPFNPSTVISYQIVHASHVRLEIFNVLGEKVAELVECLQSPGYYHVTWNGRDGLGNPVSSGIYIYRLKAGSFTSVKKMMFVK